MNHVCLTCNAYIYDQLLYPIEIENPNYPFVQIREDTVSLITPIFYRIQRIKKLLSYSTNIKTLLELLESEMDYLCIMLNENDIISRRAGTKRSLYTRRWIQIKLTFFDKMLDTIHLDHMSGFRSTLLM
jgi:hypothetical protein